MSCTVYTRGGHAFSVNENPSDFPSTTALALGTDQTWLVFTDPTTERRIEVRASDIVAIRLPKKEQP